MAFILWALLAFELIMSLTDIQILLESTFQNNGLFFQSSGNHHQHHQHNGNSNRQESGNFEQAFDYENHNSYRKNHADQNCCKQRSPIETIVVPQSLKLYTMILLHHNSTQERRNAYHHENHIDQFRPKLRQHHAEQRAYELERQKNHRNAKHHIYGHDTGYVKQQFLPIVFIVHRLRTGRISIQHPFPLVRHLLFHPVISRNCQTYHIRCKESGNHRNRHHYRIKEITCHIKADPQTGDNESELTNLSQTEPATHGYIQWLACKDYPTCTKYDLAQKNSQSNCDNWPDIFHNHGRIDHHTYRYKEDGTKQVFYRSY